MLDTKVCCVALGGVVRRPSSPAQPPSLLMRLYNGRTSPYTRKAASVILYPAIDILGGKAVRLAQGDYNRMTVYNDDPVNQAAEWQDQGASWIHVVDLDGARDGRPGNADVIARIVDSCDISVEVGGGIRSMESLDVYAQAGVKRFVLGTALVKNPDFARAATEKYGEAIVAGIDARDGRVATEGWLEGSDILAIELAKRYRAIGIRHTVYTDIARDGMQTGIDDAAYARFADATGMQVVASGGISTLDDLERLARAGIPGAILGRALYEKSFTLREAIDLVSSLDA